MEVSKEFSISNFFVTITIGIHQVLTKVNTLFPVNFLENLEDFNEKVDDVQIELDGGDDVFFGGDASHNHLGVIDDEACKIGKISKKSLMTKRDRKPT